MRSTQNRARRRKKFRRRRTPPTTNLSFTRNSLATPQLRLNLAAKTNVNVKAREATSPLLIEEGPDITESHWIHN